MFTWKKNKKYSFKLKNLQCFTQKFHILSCYDEHGTMVLYDDNVSLTKTTTITNFGVEFIIALSNDNIWEASYIIPIHKPPKMKTSCFNFILKSIIHKMPSHCPIVIIGDFNIYFLTKENQSSTLQAFMNKYHLKLTFIESTTINDTQIDHIWTNAPIQLCHFGMAQGYWTYHKPIYFTFKLFDCVPQFVLPHNTTNDVITHKCTYTQTHTNKSQNYIYIHKCTCTTSYLLARLACLWRLVWVCTQHSWQNCTFHKLCFII